ncbi:universal stress protein [Streptomyces caniferus]|uniref:Universal stress protein n=1 Tax=Streptomyces caniferus TaxID=285557 RepID=A0A640S6Y3_9ACTN|nr:universal stress protein [Streptomyces caniferus]GFE06171.1 hypothetical protein Scani_24390 [Streptomyces caniferus]
MAWTTGTRRFVVGVSGSLGSLAALHRAVGEVRHGGAELLVVLAWEAPGGAPACHRAPCPPLLAAVHRRAEERLRAALDAAFVGDLVPYRATTVRGPAGEVLVAAADHPGDVLVVGVARGGRWRRLVWPSVARYCVSHATCPVLTVPPSPLQHDLSVLRRRIAMRLPLPRIGR